MLKSAANSIIAMLGDMLGDNSGSSSDDHTKSGSSSGSSVNNIDSFVINNNSNDATLISSSNHHRFAQELIKKFVRAGSGSSSGGEAVILKGLDEGIPIDVQDLIMNGETMSCLTVSCAWDEHKITELLLQRGANPDIVNSRGFTAAHYSARNGCHNSLKLLIENRASVFARDLEGNRPLDRARAMREGRCAELLQNVETVIYAIYILVSDPFYMHMDVDSIEMLYQFL